MIMNFHNLHIGILFCFLSLNLFAQNDNQAQVKKHKFSFYGGVGPNYYFNNLVIYKNSVQPWNYSLTARLMWEPEHFLSLGIESGYYKLYTVKYTVPSFGPAMVTNLAVPVQLVVSMKFLKNYYTDLSIGQTNLLYKFSSSNMGSFQTSSWSLADFGITVGYKYLIKNRVSVCGDIKYFRSAKFTDSNMALLFIVAYNF
jgi:hypothetical protein